MARVSGMGIFKEWGMKCDYVQPSALESLPEEGTSMDGGGGK